MKKLLLALLVFCGPAILTLPALAQSNLNHFSIAGSAVGFSGAATGTAASTEGISYQFTSHVSLGYQNVMVPSVAKYDLGVFQYAVPLSSLLGKKASAGTTFDASNVTISFLGGAGVFSPQTKAPKQLAETAGVNISFPMKTSASGSVSIGPVIGLQYVHSTVSGLVVNPSAAAISAGLGISF